MVFSSHVFILVFEFSVFCRILSARLIIGENSKKGNRQLFEKHDFLKEKYV